MTVSEDTSIPDDVVEALSERRLLLLGGRGPLLLRSLAYLWCGALLDTRCDTLLLPVLVRARDLKIPLDALLELRNAECNWALPAGFFRERLTSGACLVLLHEDDESAPRGCDLMSAFPLCRYIVASGADDGNTGSSECRFDFGGAQTRCVVVDRKSV